MKKNIVLLLCLFCVKTFSQIPQKNLPIIDMHLHANPAARNGPPPTAYCSPPKELPYHDPSENWMEKITEWLKNPECENATWGTNTDTELMEQTLEILKKRNIYAVTSGNLLDDYLKNEGQRIIPAL